MIYHIFVAFGYHRMSWKLRNIGYVFYSICRLITKLEENYSLMLNRRRAVMVDTTNLKGPKPKLNQLFDSTNQFLLMGFFSTTEQITLFLIEICWTIDREKFKFHMFLSSSPCLLLITKEYKELFHVIKFAWNLFLSFTFMKVYVWGYTIHISSFNSTCFCGILQKNLLLTFDGCRYFGQTILIHLQWVSCAI